MKNQFIKQSLLLLILLLSFSLSAQANTTSVKYFRGGGSAQMQFETPFPESFTKQVLSDDKLFIQVIPGIKQWKVLKQSTTSQTARCTMAMSSMIKPSTYNVQVDKISDSEVRFKRISGDLNDLEGKWQVTRGSKEGSSLITYSYRVDTGMKFVPRGIMEQELRKHLSDTKFRVNAKLQQLYKIKQTTAIGMNSTK